MKVVDHQTDRNRSVGSLAPGAVFTTSEGASFVVLQGRRRHGGRPVLNLKSFERRWVDPALVVTHHPRAELHLEPGPAVAGS